MPQNIWPNLFTTFPAQHQLSRNSLLVQMLTTTPHETGVSRVLYQRVFELVKSIGRHAALENEPCINELTHSGA